MGTRLLNAFRREPLPFGCNVPRSKWLCHHEQGAQAGAFAVCQLCTVTAGAPGSWSGSGSSTSATATRLLAEYDAAVEIWKQGEEELRPLEDCWLRCLLFLLAPGGSPASQAGGQPGTSASSAAASSEPSGHS